MKRTVVYLLSLLAAVACVAQIAPAADPPVIFLHYDYMVSTDAGNPHSDAPNPETIRLLVESFRRRGITLVVDPRHTVLPHFNFVGFGSDGARCAEVLAHRYAIWGWGGPTTTFEALKAQYFQPRGTVPWHYAIFGHTVAYASAGLDGCSWSGGIAEVSGYDFMVSVGYFFHTPDHYAWRCHSGFDGVDDLCLRFEAGTTMHELGHNLDLHHGGDEDLNYKPNYLSVMNYMYQRAWINYAVAPGSTTFDHRELDYSDHVYPTLDENHLDERVGLGGSPDDTRIASFLSVSWIPDEFGYYENIILRAPAAAGPVDWNNNGVIEPDIAWNFLDSFMGQLGIEMQPVHGFDDWAHVQQFLNTPAYRTGQIPHGRPQP